MKQTDTEEKRMEMDKSSRSVAAFGGLRAPAGKSAMASAAPTPLNPQQGVAAVAQGQDAGELFEDTMTAPITIARHTSAMLPIVNQPIEGRKVSIYNQSTHVKHPLNGFRLHNNTPLYLMQGPITVLDGNAYAGDARIEDLAPGQDRLLSYALDLKTEVNPKVEAGQQDLLSVRLRKGVLIATHKILEEKAYQVKNHDLRAKTLLIEHPYRADWQLVEPARSTERTRDRLSVHRATRCRPNRGAARAGRKTTAANRATRRLRFRRDHVLPPCQNRCPRTSKKPCSASSHSATVFPKLPIAGVGWNSGSKRSGRSKRASVTTWADWRTHRKLYNRYVKKLDQQETEMEKLRKEIDGLKGTEKEQKRELNDYLVSLDIG